MDYAGFRTARRNTSSATPRTSRQGYIALSGVTLVGDTILYRLATEMPENPLASIVGYVAPLLTATPQTLPPVPAAPIPAPPAFRAIGVGRASVFAITAMGGPSSSVFTDETDTSSALDALLKSGFDGESLRMLALRGNEPKVLPLLCVQGAWRRA